MVGVRHLKAPSAGPKDRQGQQHIEDAKPTCALCCSGTEPHMGWGPADPIQHPAGTAQGLQQLEIRHRGLCLILFNIWGFNQRLTPEFHIDNPKAFQGKSTSQLISSPAGTGSQAPLLLPWFSVGWVLFLVRSHPSFSLWMFLTWCYQVSFTS